MDLISQGIGVDLAIIGFSQPFAALLRVSDAVREARWALEAARNSPTHQSVYGDDAEFFLPRTVAEGQVVVDRVLGRLLEYDAQHNAELVRSLEVFFAANKSWQDGARELGVHKQTLVYRMHKVEDLTGRSLRTFADQAELFMALRTLRLLHLDS
jgi:purine catabolism regulator